MPVLTSSIINSAEIKDKIYYIWDDMVKGFALKVIPNGQKKYVIKYRTSMGGRNAVQRWYKEELRIRYLSSEEMERFSEELRKAEKRTPEMLYTVAAIRLLLLTAARKNEILTCKWEWVDFDKLHRKITEWEWYSDANTFRVFMHLLLTANYEDKRWRNIDVKRGQIITGRMELAQTLRLSERQIRTALDKLKMSGVITIKTTNQYSLITVENYIFSFRSCERTT